MHECELTSSTVRGMQIRYSFINMALRRWRGEAAEEAIWQNQPKKIKIPLLTSASATTSQGFCASLGGSLSTKRSLPPPRATMTPTSPPPPCYQQLSLSPRAPRWSLEDVRSAGGGGEERRGHGTKLQDKSFPPARGEEGKSKANQPSLFFCCFFRLSRL